MPIIDFNRPVGNPLIMGILNVTPDSFSDGGKFLGHEAALAQGLRLLDEGADILDVGGESTRPPGKDYGEGAGTISPDEELARVMPVIEGIIAARPDAAISIDTMKPAVAEEAARAGVSLINDVSGGIYDERIWEVAARYDLPCVIMHGHDPHNRQSVESAEYGDVVVEVGEFLRGQTRKARAAGVRQIILDPGIGFAKRAEDSMQLIRELSRLRPPDIGDLPILVGASRKSFIGRMLGGGSPQERLFGTLGAHGAAVLNGASILRLHDVRPAVEFFRLFGALVKSE